MIYSPSPTNVMNRPLGEWCSAEAKISVEPSSRVDIGMRVPSGVVSSVCFEDAAW